MKPTDPEDSLLDVAALAQGYVAEIESDYDSPQRKRWMYQLRRNRLHSLPKEDNGEQKAKKSFRQP